MTRKPAVPHQLASSSALVLTALGVWVTPGTAAADPLAYGPDTCVQGYVWREADSLDHVCVTPAVRDQTAQQNQAAPNNVDPNGGPYGPNTCKQGFVWREAFTGDDACVTPDVRAEAAGDNAAAASRKQANAKPAPSAPSTISPPATGYINLPNGVPVGSNGFTLTMHSDGSYALNGGFHDSGAPDYDASIAWVISDKHGHNYLFFNECHLVGHIIGGGQADRSCDASYSGRNQALANGWAQLADGYQSNWSADVSMNINDSIVHLGLDPAHVLPITE